MPDLAGLASYQHQQVAERTGDLRYRTIAKASRSMLWTTISMRQDAVLLAEEAVAVTDELIATGADGAEAAGMSHVALATAAAATGRLDLAHEHIRQSIEIGRRHVDRPRHSAGVVFSTPIAQTWEVWIAAEVGEPGRVRELVRGIDIARLPVERVCSLSLDAARGLAGSRREAMRAAMHLRIAEAAGPLRTRAHTLTRETIAAVLPHLPRGDMRDSIEGLARRCGMAWPGG